MRTFPKLLPYFTDQTIRYCDASGALCFVTSAGAAMSAAPPGDEVSTWASSKCFVGHWGVHGASNSGTSQNAAFVPGCETKYRTENLTSVWEVYGVDFTKRGRLIGGESLRGCIPYCKGC